MDVSGNAGVRILLLALTAFGALCGAVLIDSKAAFGRLALRFGMPEAARSLLTEGPWSGVAAYRAGDFDAAATVFTELGEPGAFNRGNAYALAGSYAAALVAYDAAMVFDPNDRAALFNAGIITELYAGTKLEGVPLRFEAKKRTGETINAPDGQGNARAQGQGDEATNAGTSFDMPTLLNSGLRRVPKIFDDKYIAANERWLRSMQDEPGVYLRARLAEEKKQRDAAGLSPSEESDGW